MTSTADADAKFTCLTCLVAFNDPELQRAHYKTDWHRYNLKRKVAEMPPVTLEEFAHRVQIQKSQQEQAQNTQNQEMFCKLCSKHFTTDNSFANHLQSNKHKELEMAAIANVNPDSSTQELNDSAIAVKSDRAAKRAELVQKMNQEETVVDVDTTNDTDKDWEDIGETEEYDETKGIDLLTCFFCTHKSETAADKCEHMAREHSFFIPDFDYISDLEGLLKFLGVKLGVYHVCLWCSSKCYGSLDAVQKHMADKGHYRMKFEGETLLEYVDYYLYEGDTTIDDEYDIINESDMNESRLSNASTRREVAAFLEDESYELVLPSGAKLGHRSLFKYYKQSFGHRALELKFKNNQTIKDKYRAIACGGVLNMQNEIIKQRKDLAYFQRWNAKMGAKLGWETNKLQKHYRRQDITF